MQTTVTVVLDEGSENNMVHLSIQQGSASILVSLFCVNDDFLIKMLSVLCQLYHVNS